MGDVVVVGAGIVGLATARALLEARPGLGVTVLDKEGAVAAHQSGHNSGVLHSGVYYRPGSEKAVHCRLGKAAMEEYCAARGVPFEVCGKVIVATAERELEALAEIERRGLANGVRLRRIDAEALREIEPHAAGIAALHVEEAGIVDFAAVCRSLAADVESAGGTILLDAPVRAAREEGGELAVDAGEHSVRTQLLVNCAGLHSDRVARLVGVRPEAQVLPFRGEFFCLRPEARTLVRGLIYPVPDPAFPFLGVHFTRRPDGSVECGPNAVLALGREAYRAREFRVNDLVEILCWPGFWALARKYWRTGKEEMRRSASKGAFARALQRLVPAVRASDLEPAPAGVRAQAVTRDGRLVDDFLIEEGPRSVHVLNAPSPAATASLAIGATVARRALARLG